MNTIDYGTVQYEDKTLILRQQPYLSGTNEEPKYAAIAMDVEGNEYDVNWYNVDLSVEDEGDACDWEQYTVREL